VFAVRRRGEVALVVGNRPVCCDFAHADGRAICLEEDEFEGSRLHARVHEWRVRARDGPENMQKPSLLRVGFDVLQVELVCHLLDGLEGDSAVLEDGDEPLDVLNVRGSELLDSRRHGLVSLLDWEVWDEAADRPVFVAGQFFADVAGTASESHRGDECEGATLEERPAACRGRGGWAVHGVRRVCRRKSGRPAVAGSPPAGKCRSER